MKRNVIKGAGLALTLCVALGVAGCQKTEKAGDNGTQVVSSNEAAQNGKFKPSEYTLPAKDEYTYEYMGLKFILSENLKKDLTSKMIAMLDDQSPVDKDLKYATLTFNKMTDEQKNATVDKMGDGYEKWKSSLERVGTIGMFDKSMSEDEISKITKCDTHKKLGTSKDGKYNYYMSTKSSTKGTFLEEFAKTKIEIIEKKDRPENGFVLSEKSDLEATQAFDKNSDKGLANLATKDIDGKDFTGKDFAKYDLTMVNVFATWCTACVREIPDLAKVQNEMKGKGVNIVGIVTDTLDEQGINKEVIKKAKLIQEKTKASYPFLTPDHTLFNGRLIGIQALPETFFVDKNGNIVGDTYSGARNAEGWKKIIEKELANIKK
nr:TlpA disulfide reductase family protein [uncultured Peptostreptococcus sp.]